MAKTTRAKVKKARGTKPLAALVMAKKHCKNCKTNYWRQPHEAEEVETCGVCLTVGKLSDGHLEKKRAAKK